MILNDQVLKGYSRKPYDSEPVLCRVCVARTSTCENETIPRGGGE